MTRPFVLITPEAEREALRKSGVLPENFFRVFDVNSNGLKKDCDDDNPALYLWPYNLNYAGASGKNEEAFAMYKKCTELKDDSYDAWYQCGLCKYRQALDLNNTISSIKNQVKAKETRENTVKLFGEAIPFFEKARECTPDEPNKWAYELKQCYTVTGNSEKASEMSKLIDD